jgi:hypothetical protein
VSAGNEAAAAAGYDAPIRSITGGRHGRYPAGNGRKSSPL